jgi:hypothetical protein
MTADNPILPCSKGCSHGNNCGDMVSAGRSECSDEIRDATDAHHLTAIGHDVRAYSPDGKVTAIVARGVVKPQS